MIILYELSLGWRDSNGKWNYCKFNIFELLEYKTIHSNNKLE